MVADGPLHDPFARQVKQRGEPAVRAVEEQLPCGHPVKRLGAKDAQRAREVTQPRRQEEPPYGVGERRRQPARGGIATRGSHPARQRGSIERRDERRQVRGGALEVGVERGDERSARGVEPGAQRRRLSAPAREPDWPEPRLAGGESRQHGRALVRGAVVDDDQLPDEAARLERGAHLLQQAREVRRLVVRGHDDAERNARRHPGFLADRRGQVKPKEARTRVQRARPRPRRNPRTSRSALPRRNCARWPPGYQWIFGRPQWCQSAWKRDLRAYGSSGTSGYALR